MANFNPVVTIFGGAGFVGRYVARRMAKAGWQVRVVTRRPNEALFVQTYGSVGQVRPVLGNICYEASVREVISGADAVVNCVGILTENGAQNFGSIHAEGAGVIAEVAAEEGVHSLVHISAIGADPDSNSEYASSKAEGERLVRAVYPDAVIMRPSVIFGTEDKFFNRFANIAKISLVLPIFGPETKLQPVYVENVAEAVEKAILLKADAGVYELGGPEVASFHELMEQMLKIVERRRWIAAMPWWLARMNGNLFAFANKYSGGLIPAPFTRDQVEAMQYDNVVADGARSLKDLGIVPTPMDAVLESYLYCYRPSGQYAEITSSAKNLRPQE